MFLIEDLVEELKKEKYSQEYIQLCSKYYNNIYEKGLPVIFDNKHFAMLQGTSLLSLRNFAFFENQLYKVIKIPKKAGGLREIAIPSIRLGIMQRWIKINILDKIPISDFAHGFRKGKSIVTNSIPHAGRERVLNIDIKNFFPSISQKDVFTIFKEFGYTVELSETFSRICSFKGKLPQGAPSSPVISNIVCQNLDKRLGALSRKIEANYTRYADDITFSGDNRISMIKGKIEEIIRSENFEINESKTRLKIKGQRKVVTGLVVNGEKPRIPKSKKKYLRQQIYYCKKFGVKDHLKHIGRENLTGYRNHLYGFAYYIKMVEPDQGEQFIKQLGEIIW